MAALAALVHRPKPLILSSRGRGGENLVMVWGCADGAIVNRFQWSISELMRRKRI